MNNHSDQDNGQQGGNPFINSMALLEEINKINESEGGSPFHTTDLSESWANLRLALHPGEDREQLNALITEYHDNKEEWIANLYKNWIDPENENIKGPIEFSRLAAIRMLAVVAGADTEKIGRSDQSFAAEVFDKLWSVIEEKTSGFTVDARAWALLSLDSCNVEMDVDRWRKTFGARPETNSNGRYWLESVPQSQVRARAISIIGKMAEYSETALCWNIVGLEASKQVLNRCRLAKELFGEAELMLLTHWKREIDYDVKLKLVNSLGHIAGWTRLPKQKSWDVADVLREAAEWDDVRTQRRVPWTIRGISTNLIHRRDDIHIERFHALEQLANLAFAAVWQIELHTKQAGYGPTYDLQRQYVLTLRHIAVAAKEDSLLPDEQRDEIVDLVVKELFKIADGTDFLQNIVLRRTVLFFLGELSSRTKHSRELALNNFRLMLADPAPEAAKIAAENIVLLQGEEDAANYFVEIILNDTSIMDAIRHRKENWNVPEQFEIDYLAGQIRRLAAEMIGSINNNDTAHDKLVDTLRSNALLSSRARDALIVIGGKRSVESIVDYNLQQQVSDRFFEPLEKDRERGWALLEDVRGWTDGNYRYAYWAALGTMCMGIIILIISFTAIIINLFFVKDGKVLENLVAPAIGILLTISGSVGTYYWEPAKGLNKVISELSRLIMSFENYLGRMRLIGLGFAHAYTTDNFEQLQFLNQISGFAAVAMRDSAVSMKDFGSWPTFGTEQELIVVPSLINSTLKDATEHLNRAKLGVEIGEPTFDPEKASETIIMQYPPPGVYVPEAYKIRLVPSTNQAVLVEVPKLEDMCLLEALSSAQAAGILVKEIQLQFDDYAEEGTVLKQDIRANLKVSTGSHIILTIAKRAKLTNLDN